MILEYNSKLKPSYTANLSHLTSQEVELPHLLLHGADAAGFILQISAHSGLVRKVDPPKHACTHARKHALSLSHTHNNTQCHTQHERTHARTHARTHERTRTRARARTYTHIQTTCKHARTCTRAHAQAFALTLRWRGSGCWGGPEFPPSLPGRRRRRRRGGGPRREHSAPGVWVRAKRGLARKAPAAAGAVAAAAEQCPARGWVGGGGLTRVCAHRVRHQMRPLLSPEKRDRALSRPLLTGAIAPYQGRS